MSNKYTSMIKDIKTYTIGPNIDEFTPKELSLFDADAFIRNYITIKFNDMNDAIYDGLYSITRLQYQLPMKYLQPVEHSYSYVSQKAILTESNDMKQAAITIEPLNPDYMNLISYTPINQSIPIGTSVVVNISVPFDTNPDGTEPDRMYFWSNNLTTDPDIEQIIKRENPKSIRTKPWQGCVHYGSIDVGSKLECKYLVKEIDTRIVKSYNLYGFRFDHDLKELTIWVFKCYNLLPIDILKMIHDNEKCCDDSKLLIEAIMNKYK